MESSINTNNNEKYYGYWLEQWLAFTEPLVKISTFIRYRNSVKNHIEPFLGKYLVEEINTKLMESYIRNLMVNGRKDGKGGLCNKSILDILLIIKQTFRYVEAYEIPIGCNFSNVKIKSTYREMRVLSVGEEKLLAEYLIKNPDRRNLGVLLALYTGIRIGELCALQGKHILINEKVIKIEQTVQRLQKRNDRERTKTHLLVSVPKTSKAIRLIPLPEFLCFYLKVFSTGENDYWLSGAEDKLIEPRTMQNHFKRCIEKLEIKNANFHSLRHTFATRCVEVGFDLKSLSEILGHSSVKITMDRYVHSTLEQKRVCMEKIHLQI